MPTIPTKLREQATQKTKNNSNLYRYQINIKCNKWRLSERSILQISGADAKRWFTEVFTRHLFCNSENIDRFSSYALGTSLKISQGKVRENEKRKPWLLFQNRTSHSLIHSHTQYAHPHTIQIRTQPHTHTHARPASAGRRPWPRGRVRPPALMDRLPLKVSCRADYRLSYRELQTAGPYRRRRRPDQSQTRPAYR